MPDAACYSSRECCQSLSSANRERSRSMLRPRCLKISHFRVKTSTAAVCQRLLLLLTKQHWDFSREAMDSEFVKLLSPALKPEREVEINICIFILLLQLLSGDSPSPCLYLMALLGELLIIYKCRISSHLQRSCWHQWGCADGLWWEFLIEIPLG